MEIYRFRNWNIYKEAKELFQLAIKIAGKLPKEYRFSLSDQLVRAALSIVLNIAEGSGKGSDKELNRYFNIAIGSINETIAIVDVLSDLKLISQDEFEDFLRIATVISRQIGAFKKQLRKN